MADIPNRDNLQQEFESIRDERAKGANTARRIGSAFLRLLEYSGNTDNASNADHAAEADHAKEADHATEADHAKDADKAYEAGHAAEADHAKEADHAAEADLADNATKWAGHHFGDYLDQPLRQTDDVKHRNLETQNINNTDTITTRNLKVTGLAHFFQLMIDKVRSVGGRMILSAASADIDQATALITNADGKLVFRCYFRATDGDKTIDNCFEAGDMVICQTCNLRQGSQTDAANRFYWRVVQSVSAEPKAYIEGDEQTYHYIDLWAMQAVPGSDAPKAGDTIVQLGNTTNAERAGAIVMSAYSDGWIDSELKAPSIAQYYGIGTDQAHRWDLAYYRQSYLAHNGNRLMGQLISMADGEQTDVSSVLKRTEEMATEEMQLWFYDYQPEIDNEPAASWIADGQAQYHVGDLFYNTARSGDFSEGSTWRFVKQGDSYAWQPVTDAQTLKALQLYADAANDGILSGGSEKARLWTEYIAQREAYKAIQQRADDYRMDYSAAEKAWTVVARMLNGGKPLSAIDATPAWLDNLKTDTRMADYNISADDYRKAWLNWHQAYEQLDGELSRKVQAEIINTGSSITLQVKQGMKRTGIDIDAQKITLDADNTIMSGDLHLKGVLIENYTDTTTVNDDGTRTEIVACDMQHFKSVSVEGWQMVVLPMINDVKINTNKLTTPSEITIAGLQEGGVKLTIAARYDESVAKWYMSTASLYKSYPDAMGLFNQAAVPVFADPRCLSYDNYHPTGNITLEGGEGADYDGGVFVCNGLRGRLLLLMPGQTLHLTSAIETFNGRKALIWYVDNGSEFESITKHLWIYNQDVYFRSNGGSGYPSASGGGHSTYMDSIFASPKINDELLENKESILEILAE